MASMRSQVDPPGRAPSKPPGDWQSNMSDGPQLELIPPRDETAEQQTLGCCMEALDGAEAAEIAFSVVTPEDFYRTYHKQIARAVYHCWKNDGFITLPTVTAELRRRNELEEVGGMDYLKWLIAEVGLGGKYVRRYATIVAEKALLRGLMRAGSELLALGASNPSDVGEAFTRASSLLEPLQVRIQPPEPPALRTLAEIDNTPPSFLWPSWISRGQISLLFAPPGAGKSYAVLAMMKSVVLGEPWPDGQPGPEPTSVLLLDYEGTERQTRDRAALLGVPDNMVLIPPEDVMPHLNKPGSVETIRRWIGDSGVSMVVIDSLRDALPGVDENDSAAMGEALNPLKLAARDFNCSIILLHHCRKQPTSNGDRWILTMDDLRGSSVIAAAGRTILAIDKPDASRDTRKLKIVKSNFDAFPEPLGFDLTSEGLAWTSAPFAGVDMPRRTAAQEAITMALQTKPLRFAELRDILRDEHGISETTMKRALHTVATKGPDGRWGLTSHNLQT